VCAELLWRRIFRARVLLRAEDSRPAATVSIGGGDPAAILGEQSPARLLRDGELEQDGPRVLDAARAFAADA